MKPLLWIYAFELGKNSYYLSPAEENGTKQLKVYSLPEDEYSRNGEESNAIEFNKLL